MPIYSAHQYIWRTTWNRRPPVWMTRSLRARTKPTRTYPSLTALVERIRDYGYLAGIAVLAVVVGGAAMFFANPAHQESPQPMPDHGEMGGVLPIEHVAGSLLVTNPGE